VIVNTLSEAYRNAKNTGRIDVAALLSNLKVCYS
jgi:hypothetical protein